MARFYSASMRGFYEDTVHPEMPADVVEISEQEFWALFDEQAAGKEIRSDEHGRPVAAEPTFNDAELLRQIRIKRDRLLRESDFTQIPDAPLSAEQRAAWQVYRQALRDLPENYAAAPSEAVWPTPPAQL